MALDITLSEGLEETPITSKGYHSTTNKGGGIRSQYFNDIPTTGQIASNKTDAVPSYKDVEIVFDFKLSGLLGKQNTKLLCYRSFVN